MSKKNDYLKDENKNLNVEDLADVSGGFILSAVGGTDVVGGIDEIDCAVRPEIKKIPVSRKGNGPEQPIINPF